jgi:hypothetical protein
MFLKWHDSIGRTKYGPYLMGLFKEVIKKVGRENVVHIPIDGSSNN